MKTITLLLPLLMSLGLQAQTVSKFTRKTWCEGLKNNEVFPHIKSAADFADLNPLLLAIGMSSEGFAIKTDIPEKCRTWPIFHEDHTITQKQCGDGDKLVEVELPSYTNYKYDKDWNVVSQTEGWDVSAVMYNSYYGDTWPDDGADTFCLELGRLRREGVFPVDFSHDNLSKIPTYKSMSEAPDVVCDDQGAKNEPATMRFHKDSMSKPFKERWRVPSDKTEGDEGRAYFKNGETQAFANAAMWKDASNKFDTAIKELSTDYPTLKDREFSQHERIFWSKVFYNGGQGTQAGAYYMLKKYAAAGYLADDSYLTKQPTQSYGVLYENGRYTLDSYKYAVDTQCPGQWPESEKKYTKYQDLQSTPAPESNSGSHER